MDSDYKSALKAMEEYCAKGGISLDEFRASMEEYWARKLRDDLRTVNEAKLSYYTVRRRNG